MTRAEILTACIAAGIITKAPYSVNPNPPYLAKYSAMINLASDQKGRNQARAEINRMIKRVSQGKDPIADARGGKRDGAGRKNRAIVTPK